MFLSTLRSSLAIIGGIVFLVFASCNFSENIDTNNKNNSNSNTTTNTSLTLSGNSLTTITGSLTSTGANDGTGETFRAYTGANNTGSHLYWPTHSVKLDDGRTITYEFGNGNPPEVAMTPEEVEIARTSCGKPEGQIPQAICDEFNTENTGYMTPEVEQALYDFAENTDFSEIPTLCKGTFDAVISSKQYDMNQDKIDFSNPSYTFFIHQLNAIMDGSYWDMENMLIVNPATGHKRLSMDIMTYGLFVQSVYSQVYDTWGNLKGTQSYINPTPEMQSCTDALQNMHLNIHNKFQDLYITGEYPRDD